MGAPVHRVVEYRSEDDGIARRSYKASAPAAKAEANKASAERGRNGSQVEDAVAWRGEAVALGLLAVMVQCVGFHVMEASQSENQQRPTQHETEPSSQAH